MIDYTIVYVLGPVDNRLQEFRISVRLDLILIGADVKNIYSLKFELSMCWNI